MSKSSKKGSQPSNKTTQADVSRIQSAVARQHDGAIPKESYVGRMQAKVAQNNGKTDSQ